MENRQVLPQEREQQALLQERYQALRHQLKNAGHTTPLGEDLARTLILKCEAIEQNFPRMDEIHNRLIDDLFTKGVSALPEYETIMKGSSEVVEEKSDQPTPSEEMVTQVYKDHCANAVASFKAYNEILTDYCDYDKQWAALPDAKREIAEPSLLLRAYWTGSFYNGSHQDKKFFPFIRMVEHLAAIDPAYVAILQNAAYESLKPSNQDVSQRLYWFNQAINDVCKHISDDALENRKIQAESYIKDLLQHAQRNPDDYQYVSKITDDLYFKYILSPETSDEQLRQSIAVLTTEVDGLQPTGKKHNLKIVSDLLLLREKILQEKAATDNEIKKLQKDVQAVKFVLGTTFDPGESSANLDVANAAAEVLAVGEGMVAASAVPGLGAAFGVSISLPLSFALVGSSGAFANFYLTRDDTKTTLDSLGSTVERSPTRNIFQKMLDWGQDLVTFKLKLFFNSDGTPLSTPKRVVALAVILLAAIVGGLFGYLSLISGWGVLTGLVLGSSVIFPPLGILLALGALTAATMIFAMRSKGLAKWLTLGLLGLVTVGLGYIAMPLVAGVIAGLVSVIAISSAITLAAILYVAIVDSFIKVDVIDELGKYLRRTFINDAWNELTLWEKTKHIGHCALAVLRIGLTVAVNVLSLAGQFVLFSAAMLHTFGSAPLAYALAAGNGLVHIPFGFINVQQRLDALMSFARTTYATLTSPAPVTEGHIQRNGRSGILPTVVGFFAAVINGIGQGGLYGLKFLAGSPFAATAAVGLAVFLHIPFMTAVVVFGVGAFLFSALPNTNALAKTLSKGDVVPIRASSTTKDLFNLKPHSSLRPAVVLNDEAVAGVQQDVIETPAPTTTVFGRLFGGWGRTATPATIHSAAEAVNNEDGGPRMAMGN